MAKEASRKERNYPKVLFLFIFVSFFVVFSILYLVTKEFLSIYIRSWLKNIKINL